MHYQRLYDHVIAVARCPSFSSYEERLHPYIREVFRSISSATELPVPGNNLVFRLGNSQTKGKTIALAAHLDKINHFGHDYPDSLPVENTETYLQGVMDDSTGVGLLLTLAEMIGEGALFADILFFFSEMEESKGLKEHPELLKNDGKGYQNGMGANRIAQFCKTKGLIPEVVITCDTTPLFKGKRGIALYDRHWELTDLEPTEELKKRTATTVSRFQQIEPDIQLDNNTNDYLHYGYAFNHGQTQDVVSVALEPAIYPYHQRNERVFKKDISKTLDILLQYLSTRDKALK